MTRKCHEDPGTTTLKGSPHNTTLPPHTCNMHEEFFVSSIYRAFQLWAHKNQWNKFYPK